MSERLSKWKDITDDVDFQNPDDECLPLTKCVCGKKFEPWSFIISIYEDYPYHCPACGEGLIFRQIVRIYKEVSDE